MQNRPARQDEGPAAAPASGAAGLRWLADHAWPLWLAHGVDWDRRAFHEHLDLVTLDCAADFRRLRVAARQTYVFSKAAVHGIPGAADAVALGVEFLRGPARLAAGGYAWRFDLANRPIDRTRDLYDHAFVLLAYAAAASVMGVEALRTDAAALANHLQANFSHPAGGFQDSIADADLKRMHAATPRRQNPHMHLFEACLAADEIFGDAIFLAIADTIAELFVDRLFQRREGALPEFFDADWAPVRDKGRFLLEPGHHYEWAWLLDRHAQRTATIGRPAWDDLAAAAEALVEFADRYALDPGHGLVMNAIWSDGSAADAAFRLWPQTERLKAAARRAPAPCVKPLAGVEKHLAGAPAGLWIERINAYGQPIPEPAPATSLYHLTAALTDEAVAMLATPI